MTREDRELLLIDICGRLPHETWVQYEGKEWLATGYGHGRVSLLPSIFSSVGGPCPLVEDVRPYLRPMSSMTEEERNNLRAYCRTQEGIIYDIGVSGAINSPAIIDFLNAHHFDYRGLIEKGLALEAPEGMYKTE